MVREMSVVEAAAELRVSRRTIERQINAGILESRTEGRRRIVIMPDAIDVPDWEPEPQPRAVVPRDLAVQTARLAAELETLRAENEWLRGLVSAQLESVRQAATPRPGWWERIRRRLIY
jgi:hypothetical protein